MTYQGASNLIMNILNRSTGTTITITPSSRVSISVLARVRTVGRGFALYCKEKTILMEKWTLLLV